MGVRPRFILSAVEGLTLTYGCHTMYSKLKKTNPPIPVGNWGMGIKLIKGNLGMQLIF